MSSDEVLIAEDVSKCYCIYAQPGDRIKQALARGAKKHYREVWALNHVGISVKKGETVGVIGRNGSGKSTLLQILTGVLEPTSGSVSVRGLVGAVLELGAGFNPDFTGRENVFLGATIAGLDRQEIEARYSKIVEFAELAPYMDQPVKTYSTGMFVRLAFAIQVMVPKDVLIVDEALAVGDEAFQRKCFGKLEEFKNQGGTTLLVSHAASTVVDLCDRALLLDGGELLLEGDAADVVKLYQRLIYAPSSDYQRLRQELLNQAASAGRGGAGFGSDSDSDSDSGSGSGPLALASRWRSEASAEADKSAFWDTSVAAPRAVRYVSRGARIVEPPRLTDDQGRPVNLLRRGGLYYWSYDVHFDRDAANVRFGMMVSTVTGVELAGAAAPSPSRGFPEVPRGSRVHLRFAFRARLAPTTYFLNAGIVGAVDGEEGYLDRWVDVGSFRVLPDGTSPMTGLVDLQIDFDVKSVDLRTGMAGAATLRGEGL